MVTRKLPVQSDIRTLARKKLWRLGLQFPRSCMDKLILNADKYADKWVFPKLANPQTLGITSKGQIAQLVEQRTENPCVGGSIPPLATAI